MTVQDQLYQIIRNQFPRFRGELTASTTARQVPGWDSFSHVNLIFEIEDQLGIVIDPSETFDFANIGELVSFLEKKLNAAR